MSTENETNTPAGPSSNLPAWMRVDGAGTLETLAIWGIPAMLLLGIAFAVYAWRFD